MKFAAKLAKMVKQGDVLALTGELGAGKTCFVKGLANELGVKETVTSPTFALLKTYHGLMDLYHLDLYRLDRIEDLLDIGIEDYLPGDGITVIEWGDKAGDLLPEDTLFIDFRRGSTDDQRSIMIKARGREWTERMGRFNYDGPRV